MKYAAASDTAVVDGFVKLGCWPAGVEHIWAPINTDHFELFRFETTFCSISRRHIHISHFVRPETSAESQP